MKNRNIFRRTYLSALIATLVLPQALQAAPLDLAQYPAGSANRQPTPNVIVSVDNSGSMGNAGIRALKTALEETFDPSNLPDGSIRLAYQAMWGCNTIPSSSTTCYDNRTAWNTMRELKGINYIQGGTANRPTYTYDQSHRSQFFRWISTLRPESVTPTHRMMWNAGEYLKTTGADNPWNAEPGKTDKTPLSCRRSYHILMTDGGWNNYPDSDLSFTGEIAIKNSDGTDTKLPDGVNYSASAGESTIYSDKWGNGTTSIRISNKTYTVPYPTVSDMAFHYWATDLQPNIKNELSPLIKKSGSETFQDAGKSRTLSQYWNPKNNPATWQNMSTFTIGYNDAAKWPDIKTNPIFNVQEGMYGGDFAKAVIGSKVWRDPIAANEAGRQEELWHAAINSRGQFYPAASSQDLKNAFNDIIGTIVADNTRPITGFVGTSTDNTRSDIGEFISGYDANGWSGYVRSDLIAKITGARSANPAWGVNAGQAAPNDRKTTAEKLDALTNLSNRLILTSNDTTNRGVSFEWETGTNKLSAGQKAALGTGTLAQDRLNYIRGDRSKEGSSNEKPLRERRSRQGDIVNSSVWYVGAPASNYGFDSYASFARTHKSRNPMIYVGGNDGMLHGFSALDGEEKIAYVPKGVIPNLAQLTSPSYNHLYYVDGSPFTGDVNWGTTATPDWRTLLVGSLGAGGKGYFILDVTRPGSTDNSVLSNFSAANASDRVVLDNTWHASSAQSQNAQMAEADIGNIFAGPVPDPVNPYKATQLTRLNNGKWALVMGNGYNSTNERPVLLIQYLDKTGGDMSLKRLVAASSGDDASENGLSAPRLVDINGDGKPDVAYAGDLKGNMWKFDISSSDAADWHVAFNGAPLYKATYNSGNTVTNQPITVVPTVKANDRGVGGMMVAFGTGRNLTEGDRTDVSSKQSIYSVLDNTIYKITAGKVTIDSAAPAPAPLGTGTSKLVEQRINTNTIAGTNASVGRVFWGLTQNPVNYTGDNAKKGWFFVLPEPGERSLKTLSFYDASNILEVLTQIPASGGNSVEEICNPSPQEEKQFRTFFNIMDGKRPSVQILDVNGDGAYNDLDRGASRMTTSKGAQSSNQNKDTTDVTGTDGKTDKIARMPEQPIRPSWRQLQ